MGLVSGSVSRLGGRRVISILGGVCVAVAAGFPVTPLAGSRTLGGVLLVSFLVGASGLAFAYAGYRLPQTSVRADLHDVVASWCVRAMAIMLGIVSVGALANALHDPVSGFVVLPSLAGVAGLGMGYHDARARTRALDAEERQREAERYSRELERYHTIVETVNDGIFVIDEEARFTLVNDAYTELLGYDREELIGSPSSMVAAEETDVETMTAEIRRDLLEGTVATKSYESTVETASGEKIDVESTVAVLPEQADGGSDRVVVVRDVTERNEREQELEQYEQLVETVDDGIYAVDSDAKFVLVNDAFCEMTGYDRAELLGSHATTVHDDDITSEAARLAADVAAGDREEAIIELDIRRKDGERLPAESRIGPFPMADGTGRCGVVRDVSERVERERELERQNERLESFASMLAHELRNPVTIGQIYGQQLPSEADAEAVEYVTEAFERIEDMIDVMLVLAKGREAVSGDGTVALAAVARDAWDEVDAPDATLDVKGDAAIEADETYVRHLFRNLFDNAVEHGSTSRQPEADDAEERGATSGRTSRDDAVEHGGPGVTVTVGELPDGFYVEDDGSGIPADERETVFEAGYTTTAGHGGTGLGLAFVRELADVYGWECRATESASGGARFEFTNVAPVHHVTE